ncbi:MAG: tetratricopeptide repeat protein [Paracoccaceae bacterium]
MTFFRLISGAISRQLSVFLISAFLLSLTSGLLQAQSWNYVQDVEHNEGAKTNIAAIQTDQALLGVLLDQQDLVYVMFLSALDIGDTDKISLRIRVDGNWEILQVYRDEFIQLRVDEGEIDEIFFHIQPDILELLMRADLARVRTGGQVFSIPMTGSRAAVSNLFDWGDDVMAQSVEQEVPFNQAMNDCDHRTAHPWDMFRETDGVKWGDLNAELAISACREAAATTSGRTQTRAIYQLGRALDKAGNAETLEMLTEAGEVRGYAAALGHLGVFFEDGDFVTQSDGDALYYFELAAEKGFAPAQLNFAELALKVAPARKREAYDYLRASAEGGYPRAMEMLADEILNGTDLPDGDDYALQLLQQASQEGLSAATMKVAAIFRDGVDGVEKSPTDYLEYLKFAARQGNKDAQEALSFE